MTLCTTSAAAMKVACVLGTEDRKKNHKTRNWIGFWILGLSNHYAFFTMLTAAHDILSPKVPALRREFCNPISTGSFLVADAVPALTVITLSPFLFRNTTARILITIAFAFGSFTLTGVSTTYFMSFFGVISGSVACGFGEASMLMYATQFDIEIVSGWSSGTGASSLIASAIYLLLSMFLRTKTTLLIMNIVPCLMGISYWFILVHPETESLEAVVCQRRNSIEVTTTGVEKSIWKRLKSRLDVIRDGLWYAIPLFLATFFMYFINLGLIELLYFKDYVMDQDAQYRLYSTLSALGVFISRSSVQLVKIKNLWICSLLNACILIFLTIHVMNPFLPSIHIALTLIFLAGIFGGAAYVNTFYNINNVCEIRQKSTITAMSLIGNELACAAAGFIAIPAHGALCRFISSSLSVK